MGIVFAFAGSGLVRKERTATDVSECVRCRESVWKKVKRENKRVLSPSTSGVSLMSTHLVRTCVYTWHVACKRQLDIGVKSRL